MDWWKKERFMTKMDGAKPCPFCGSKSVSAVHNQVKFLGKNYRGDVKLKMRCYIRCNQCFSRSKPLSYIGYSRSSCGVYMYSDSAKGLALDYWNRRKEVE